MHPVIFIADLHLAPGEDERIVRFLSFLKQLQTRQATLYILGDLFNFWLGKQQASLQPFRTLVKALRHFSFHQPLFFLDGNRDFLYAPYWRQEGGEVIADGTLLHLPYRVPQEPGSPSALYSPPSYLKTLIFHGDVLCTADIHYMKWRSIVRSSWVYACTQLLPASLCMVIGHRMRRMSQKAIARKNAAEIQISIPYVQEIMQRTQAEVLICGHQHHETVANFTIDGKPARLYVLPENMKSRLRYLVWHNGQFFWEEY